MSVCILCIYNAAVLADFFASSAMNPATKALFPNSVHDVILGLGPSVNLKMKIYSLCHGVPCLDVESDCACKGGVGVTNNGEMWTRRRRTCATIVFSDSMTSCTVTCK